MKAVSPRIQQFPGPILPKQKRLSLRQPQKILVDEQRYSTEGTPNCEPKIPLERLRMEQQSDVANGNSGGRTKNSPTQNNPKMKLFEFPKVLKGKPTKMDLAQETLMNTSQIQYKSTSSPQSTRGAFNKTSTLWKPAVTVQHHIIPGIARISNGDGRSQRGVGINGSQQSIGSVNSNQKFNMTQSVNLNQDAEIQYNPPDIYQAPIVDPDVLYSQLSQSPFSQDDYQSPTKGIHSKSPLTSSRNFDKGKFTNPLYSSKEEAQSNSKNYSHVKTMQQIASSTFQSGQSTSKKKKHKKISNDLAHVLTGQDQHNPVQKKRSFNHDIEGGLRSGSFQFQFPSSNQPQPAIEMIEATGGRDSEFMSLEQYHRVIQETETLMMGDEETKRSRAALIQPYVDDESNQIKSNRDMSSPYQSRLQHIGDQRDSPSSANWIQASTYFSYVNNDEGKGESKPSQSIIKAQILHRQTSKSRQKYQSALPNNRQFDIIPQYKANPIVNFAVEHAFPLQKKPTLMSQSIIGSDFAYPQMNNNQNPSMTCQGQTQTDFRTKKLSSFTQDFNTLGEQQQPGFLFNSPGKQIATNPKKAPVKSLGLLKGMKKNLKLIREERDREKSNNRFQKLYDKLKVSLDPIMENSISQTNLQQSVSIQTSKVQKDYTIISLEQRLKDMNMLYLDTNLIQLHQIQPQPFQGKRTHNQSYSLWNQSNLSINEDATLQRYMSPPPATLANLQVSHLSNVNDFPSMNRVLPPITSYDLRKHQSPYLQYPQLPLPKAASALSGSVQKKQLIASYKQEIKKYVMGRLGHTSKLDSSSLMEQIPTDQSEQQELFKIDLSKLNQKISRMPPFFNHISGQEQSLHSPVSQRKNHPKLLVQKKAKGYNKAFHQQRHSMGAQINFTKDKDSFCQENQSGFDHSSRLKKFNDRNGSPVISPKKEYSVQHHHQLMSLTTHHLNSQDLIMDAPNNNSYVKRQQFGLV